MSRYATLLLLLKHMGFVNGRVQFQKLIFLLEKNYHIKTEYDFIPFKFGPYCQVVQQDIQHLIDYGYVEHEEVEKTSSEVLHRYQITEYGEQYLLENDFGDIYDQGFGGMPANFDTPGHLSRSTKRDFSSHWFM